MPDAPSPSHIFQSYQDEIDLLESSGRTGAPTFDPRSAHFGQPFDDFSAALSALRDEVEARAYLAIVAAGEAVLQMDFRARASCRASVPLRSEARGLLRAEKEKRRRIVVDDILDAWTGLPEIRKSALSNYKQLLSHRHWLAHGRYFSRPTPVPADPGFAFQRTEEMLGEILRVEPLFPRR